VIVEFLEGAFGSVLGWVLGFLPAFSTVGINAGLASILGPFSTGVNDLGAWLPWSAVQVWLPITMSLYISGLGIRAVKSFIPTISG
jgi:hypothetical protein